MGLRWHAVVRDYKAKTVVADLGRFEEFEEAERVLNTHAAAQGHVFAGEEDNCILGTTLMYCLDEIE